MFGDIMGSVAETVLPQDCLHSRHVVRPTYRFNVVAGIVFVERMLVTLRPCKIPTTALFLQGFWQTIHHFYHLSDC